MTPHPATAIKLLVLVLQETGFTGPTWGTSAAPTGKADTALLHEG